MNIRLEQEKDYFNVENLTREAFWNVYRPGCMEHYVVHNLRKDKAFVKELDYVIEEDGKIFASIFYATANVKLENGEYKAVLIFGPVSVHPKYQHKGYGESIINYTLQKAKDLGYEGVFITGNPDYYKKYRFEPASKYGVYYEGMDKNEESSFFMVKVLDDKKMEKIKGIYSDPSCYMVKDEEVEEYDKLFSPKIKEVKEGQLV